jgi:hypothetical protein
MFHVVLRAALVPVVPAPNRYHAGQSKELSCTWFLYLEPRCEQLTAPLPIIRIVDAYTYVLISQPPSMSHLAPLLRDFSFAFFLPHHIRCVSPPQAKQDMGGL